MNKWIDEAENKRLMKWQLMHTSCMLNALSCSGLQSLERNLEGMLSCFNYSVWSTCFKCVMSSVLVFARLLFTLVLHSGSNYYVRILSTIDRELLKPNASVALHKHSNALVDVLPPEADSSIMMLTSGKQISVDLRASFNSSSPWWPLT